MTTLALHTRSFIATILRVGILFILLTNAAYGIGNLYHYVSLWVDKSSGRTIVEIAPIGDGERMKLVCRPEAGASLFDGGLAEKL